MLLTWTCSEHGWEEWEKPLELWNVVDILPQRTARG